jgi:site-specific DNA-methyltransferase (adenine-specific)
MIHLGDCLDVLKTLPDNSIDSVVTDPPYGLRFMAKKWDYDVPSIDVWRECLRVLKPGGHMLVACGTRTQHRMVAPIEDAGFEIRDVITWLYGSGFPKSLDVSKAIDKEAGAERQTGPVDPLRASRLVNQSGDYSTETGWSAGSRKVTIDPPAIDAAKQWEGWGTALKPACEFWTLARKPLSESTVAKNVLKWGTGGINVDGCRVASSNDYGRSAANARGTINAHDGFEGKSFKIAERDAEYASPLSRFPANLILDEEAGAALDEQVSRTMKMLAPGNKNKTKIGHGKNVKFSGSINGVDASRFQLGGDPSKASRFFYCPKSSKSDRGQGNGHPTVKPTSLMAYLCRLITPPGGTVLDPFTGSGSTGVAAIREGFAFVGIEREPEYAKIAKARINAAS